MCLTFTLQIFVPVTPPAQNSIQCATRGTHPATAIFSRKPVFKEMHAQFLETRAKESRAVEEKGRGRRGARVSPGQSRVPTAASSPLFIE